MENISDKNIYKFKGRHNNHFGFHPLRGGCECEMAKNSQSSEKKELSLVTPSSSFNLYQNIIGFGAISLCLTTISAMNGLLPGSLLEITNDGMTTVVQYTEMYLLRDVGTTLLTAVMGYAFVKAVSMAHGVGYISSRDSRKIIHTLSAPLFMLFWPLFSPARGSQFFCALVPTTNALRLYLASLGQGDESLAKAVSRSGDLREAVGGPLIYVCIIAMAILVFWRNSAPGIVALCVLAVGDGLADLIGRRYGKSNKWPGLKKSVAGSAAFWIGSSIATVGMLQWMQYWNCLSFAQTLTISDILLRAALIGLVTAALELVPVGDDNFTVPLSGAILAWLLFPV